jgi:hypothetical protein
VIEDYCFFLGNANEQKDKEKKKEEKDERKLDRGYVC